MRGLTTACVPKQTEKRIARALFVRQSGVELQHQREHQQWLSLKHIAMTQDRISAKLRNKSPERSAEYCRVKIQHNERFLNIIPFANREHFAERSHFARLQSVHTSTKGTSGGVSTVIPPTRTENKWQERL